MMHKTFAIVLVTLAGLISSSAFAQVEPYPNKIVRIIVPFPGGGTADAVPRIVAEKLTARWGKPVIIDNRPGAGGNIGADQFSRAEADGYTLMCSPPGPIAVNDSLYKSLSYDPTKFVPISLLATTVSVLATRPALSANSVEQLIQMAKQAPGKLAYASQGNGSTSHLTAAMFQQRGGIEMLHVPYKGSPAAIAGLMGGQVDIFFDNISSSLAQHRAGKIRILAVAGLRRSSALPEIPTIHESGLSGFQSISWNALVGPERLPDSIAQRISEAVAETLKLPDVQEKYGKLSAEPIGGSPAETRRFIAEERARWRQVIRDAKVTAD
jgi:tripartite-type tricarboxylate transporter receptor subunit TctC